MLDAADEPNWNGTEIDQRYRLEEQIGKDQFGAVFRAHDIKMQRAVAVRLLAQDVDLRWLEGRLPQVAALNHPHIAVLYDYDLAADTPYLVTEFGPLAYPRSPIAVADAVNWLRQAVGALLYAHNRGIAHGWLDGGNVLRKPRGVLITDIGLSESAAKSEDVRAIGRLLRQLLPTRLQTGVARPSAAHGSQNGAWLAALADELLSDHPPSLAAVLETLNQQVTAATQAPTPAQKGEGAAVLTVRRHSELIQQVTMSDDVLTVGTASDNAIVLKGGGVAPYHVRLERLAEGVDSATTTRRQGDRHRSTAGWQVVDLYDGHSTELNGDLLLPDQPENWLPNQSLRLGVYVLTWEPLDERAAATHVAASSTGAEAAAAAVNQSRPDAIGGTLAPDHAYVTLGEPATFELSISNPSPVVLHGFLDVEGVDSSWVSWSSRVIRLMPSSQATRLLFISPPRSSQSQAGEYSFLITVTLQGSQERVEIAGGSVEIAPYVEFDCDLRPRNLSGSGSVVLTLSNDGNTDLAFRLLLRDPGAQLVFSGVPVESVPIEPSAQRRLVIGLRAAQRPWVGASRLTNYSIIVTPDAGDATTLTGQFEIRSKLPAWLIPIFGVFLIFGCLLSLFVFNQSQTRQSRGVVTADAMTAQVRFGSQLTQSAAELGTLMAPPVLILPTVTPIPTLTPLPTSTPTNTPLPTATPTATSTTPPTATPTPVPTDTPLPEPTDTPSPPATETPSAGRSHPDWSCRYA